MAKVDRVLVTGGTGFIGSHLVRYLEKYIDNMSILTLNGADILTDSKYYQGNISNYSDCLRIIGQANPDVVFHLAAQPIVDTALKVPSDTMETNIKGSFNILQALKEVGCAKSIVFVSTDKVYGEQSGALTEDMCMLGVNHPYDVSKLCGDVIAQTYAKCFDLPIVIIRSGNIYGGGDLHWDRLVPGAMKSVIRGQYPTLRSDGKYHRDYIYIDDIINAYIHAAGAILDNKIPFGTVLNFGSEKSYSVLDVMDEILLAAGRIDLNPIIKNTAQHEIHNQHLNYELAHKTLGWKPKISLRDGIEKTYRWYKEYLW